MNRIITMLASLIVGILLGWLFRQHRTRLRPSRTNEECFPSLTTYYDIAAGTDYDAKEEAWSKVMREVVDSNPNWTELERHNIHRMLTQSKPNWYDYAEAQEVLNK